MNKQKILLACICCTALGQSLPAQTFNEWFRQGKTRKKYLIKQVAALEDLLLTCEKGWHIAEEGIRDIGDLKNGEFDLHQSYFESLENVNPVIKKDEVIKDILLKEQILTEDIIQSYEVWEKSPFLQAKEIGMLSQVCLQLGESSEQLTYDLQDLTLDGRYTLTDGERLLGIQALEMKFLKHYHFARAFMDNTDRLIAQRRQEAADLSILKKFFYE